MGASWGSVLEGEHQDREYADGPNRCKDLFDARDAYPVCYQIAPPSWMIDAMPAFCRLRDTNDQPRLALAKNFCPTDQVPLVCVVADVIGDDRAAFWNTDQRWLADPAGLIHELGTLVDDAWRPCPSVLLPPIDRPEKILCIGLNYRDHAIETGADIPSIPVVFSKFNSAIIGHGQPIVLPHISDQIDYEAELVVVIGKTARHVAVDDAMDHVFGYTAGHDVSSRDWQKGRPGGQWLLGKTFDTFAPIGPCVVTRDTFGSDDDVPVTMTLNGETMQHSTTKQLIFPIADLIAHLSQFMTLRPGDLIFTGTPPGVGAARTPPRFLTHGDVCEVTVAGIGTLINPCVAESIP